MTCQPIGQRFLINKVSEDTDTRSMTVVVPNWTAELAKR